MSTRNLTLCGLQTTTWVLLGLAVASPAGAQIYKCEGDGGTIAYSQTPCPNKPSTEILASTQSASDADCSYANRFAQHAAGSMRGGASSDQVFARFGGLDSMSKGSINIVNYVFQFRSNEDVAIERIASLSEAKCKAGSLGDVSCEALPIGYTDTIGGCDADNGDEHTEILAANDSEDTATIEEVSATPVVATPAPRDTPQTGDAYRACREPIEHAIEAIDEQMRRGYSSAEGEVFRERLRDLTTRLRECKRYE